MPIASPTAKIAHHIVTGAFEFPYAVDAQQAVAGHPLEWSSRPWDPDEATEARKRLHESRVAEAEQRGEAPPAPLPEPDFTDEEREIITEHRKRQAEAKALLDAKEAEEAKKRDEEAALDQARAVLASQPSLPPRRPGRPTTKVAAERDKATRDKIESDRKAAAADRDRARPATENQFNEE